MTGQNVTQMVHAFERHRVHIAHDHPDCHLLVHLLVWLQLAVQVLLLLHHCTAGT
jgi:hypothetical protein